MQVLAGESPAGTADKMVQQGAARAESRSIGQTMACGQAAWSRDDQSAGSSGLQQTNHDSSMLDPSTPGSSPRSYCEQATGFHERMGSVDSLISCDDALLLPDHKAISHFPDEYKFAPPHQRGSSTAPFPSLIELQEGSDLAWTDKLWCPLAEGELPELFYNDNELPVGDLWWEKTVL